MEINYSYRVGTLFITDLLQLNTPALQADQADQAEQHEGEKALIKETISLIRRINKISKINFSDLIITHSANPVLNNMLLPTKHLKLLQSKIESNSGSDSGSNFVTWDLLQCDDPISSIPKGFLLMTSVYDPVEEKTHYIENAIIFSIEG